MMRKKDLTSLPEKYCNQIKIEKCNNENKIKTFNKLPDFKTVTCQKGCLLSHMKCMTHLDMLSGKKIAYHFKSKQKLD